ncbi:low choriolytic enzyme-like isoform X2 [Cebidichthys violaceus]|uniref:low choriolytic enzyme-like isoform X2 n=1 Tax=Cebidichthys violaceus TaxID=271503 RepID=UPI0035CA54C4
MDLKATLSLFLLLSGLCCAHQGIDHGTDNEEEITQTILRMNNGSRDFLFEGDVLIAKTRTAMKCLHKVYSCLWQESANGNVDIPFLLSNKYDDAERNEILSAMKDFEDKTCIRFIPRANQRAYLSIEPKSGCSSSLGRIGEKQVVSLQRFGCIQRGIIQHELLHAMGFYHEHSRSDRDRYIRINFDNIPKYYAVNFQKMDTNNLNTPYDYTSVMHYGRTAFGMNRKETITPIPDSSAPIGQRDKLSKFDILRINRLYKCRSHM